MNETIIEEMARHTARKENEIERFYDDPENEKAFQEWFEKKFGRRESA